MVENLKPPISAYIRTLNEERMIVDVITAARQIAREVVVVDSGSTDRTVDLAKSAGARVIHQEWLGNGLQKRIAEDACENDWLLDLDADEITSAALAEEIAALFADGAPAHAVYQTDLALAPPIRAPWRNFGRAYRTKLYNRRIIRQPAHAVWDQLEVPGTMETGKLKEPLLHYSFTGVDQYLGKLNRNSSVRANALPLKSRSVLAVRICFGLPVYFLKVYILRQYFRGGVYGFALALLSGFGRWLRDVKMWERHAKTD